VGSVLEGKRGVSGVIGGKGEREREYAYPVGSRRKRGGDEGVEVVLSVQSMVMCVGKSILSLCSCGFKSARAV